MVGEVQVKRLLFHLSMLSAAFLGGALASGAVWAGRTDGDDTYRKLAIFARVLNYVENNYVADVEADKLIYGAIRGMLATLDAHSSFMEPEQFAAVRSEAQGEFGGIGVEIVKRDEQIVIVERHRGTPAERAGLQVGDTIAAVGGKSTAEASLARVVQWIKGPPGTKLKLSVQRARNGKVDELELTRARIRVVPVVWRQLEPGMGYIKIKSFTERTAYHVNKALDDLKKGKGGLAGLVIDVRDNPGGLLDESVRVSDLWISGGVIVSTEGRNRAPDMEMAHPKGTEKNYPIVVLVNGGTASAAEILGGALQDHKRATLLGTQTYGKGSVQTVIELQDKSALKLTIARYFTPRHRSIQGTGITPDMVVPVIASDNDRSENTSASNGLTKTDNQLSTAITVLKRWIAGSKDRNGK